MHFHGVMLQEKPHAVSRSQANGAIDPEDHFRATLDQALAQLQTEVRFLSIHLQGLLVLWSHKFGIYLHTSRCCTW